MKWKNIRSSGKTLGMAPLTQAESTFSTPSTVNCTSATSYNCDATITFFLTAQQWCTNCQYFLFRYLHSTSCITNWPTWSLNAASDLNNFTMTHQHTEAKIISPKKRETLTEPHYMFCGTPVEEHCCRKSGLLWL